MNQQLKENQKNGGKQTVDKEEETKQNKKVNKKIEKVCNCFLFLQN